MSTDDLTPERLTAALDMVDSEAFMWLMAGSNHQDSQIEMLRATYKKYRQLGGGWGK